MNDRLDDIFAGATDTTVRVPSTPAAREHIERTTAPGFVQKCARCRGTGQTPWGTCFACKGAKQKVLKSSPEQRHQRSMQRAARKAQRDQDAVQAWKAAHPAAHEWLVVNAPKNDFAQSLLNKLGQYGSLTDGQLAAVERSIAKEVAWAQEREQAAQSAPVVASEGIDRLKAAFDAAAAYIAAKGLKRENPKITIGNITISPAKANSANPGALYVKDGGTYLGKIADGKFRAGWDCSEEQKAQVLAFVADPAQAAQVYGQDTGTCCICNATLRSEWRHRGIGPICAQKFGW